MNFIKIRSYLRDYFTFNTRERRGIYLLLLILCINIGFLFFIKYFYEPNEFIVEELKLSELIIDSVISDFNAVDTDNFRKKNSKPELHKLENFDPNTVDDSTLKKFGLSQKQINVFMNFRNKGAKFYKKEDLANVYGITQEQYESLYPFIVINRPGKQFNNRANNYRSNRFSFKKIEINNADTMQLKQLPMIGSGRARMIVNYRNALGGFYSVDQLKEVYTIDSAVYSVIHDKLKVDSNLIIKIDINATGLKHPYINYKLSRAIDAYKVQHGNFQQIEELKNLKIIEIELYNKLVPYLTIE